jgi:hypothetical protein
MGKVEKMNVSKLSNEDLQDMFETAYREQVGSLNKIDEFECKCTKEGNAVTAELTISGMAGSPTIEEYKSGKVKKAGAVTISKESKGSLTFKMSTAKADTYVLNSTDYVVVYKSV